MGMPGPWAHQSLVMAHGMRCDAWPLCYTLGHEHAGVCLLHLEASGRHDYRLAGWIDD